MERQSSRIYFQGKYHKDIYFQGHYHKAAYMTDGAGNATLVWEKLGNQPEEFSFEIILTENPCLFRLFLCGSVDVDWGDGSSSGVSSEELADQGHWYHGIGKYTVHIRGTLTDIGFISKDALTRVVTVFPETMRDKKDFGSMFQDCGSLYSIPPGLFDNCPGATSFTYVFRGSALRVIPSGLFDRCRDASYFQGAFSGCHSIEGIPSGLFDNCPNVLSFDTSFYACEKITEIPKGLFDNCSRAWSFDRTFSHCFGLESIPTGLFSNCPARSRFTGTFQYCRAVTSRVPELWETHPDASHDGCFLGCTSAANYDDIPYSWRKS